MFGRRGRYASYYARENQSKYRNVKTAGFDSKAERNDYVDLHLLEKAGKIKYLQRQVSIPLQKKSGGIYYKADFVYYDCESKEWIIFDTKGMVTDSFRIKKAWLCDRYTGFIFVTNFRAKGKKELTYPTGSEDLSLVFNERYAT